ncbi:MAG: GIY-YIG nuclease family protein [Patescibacteria group bacterium]|nr:GIY-YIG nuclease family protein [Patescibacteria group bacterium]MDD4610422.1 GIY-YIG nuclease family protein [Patescibacteria group bacterium]
MFLYILESLIDFSHYVGITHDVTKRLNEHNHGKSKFTSRKIPWIVIYIEQCPDIKSARKREKYLKSYSGVNEKREIIKKFTTKK